MNDLSILVFIPGKPSQFLDLGADNRLRESKQLTEMNFDKLKFNYTLGFTIPVNEHNQKILRNFSNPNILDNDYAYLDVQVITKSKVHDDVSLNVSKKGKVYEVELRLKSNHWARLAKSLKLNQLPYSTVVRNCDHLTNVILEYPYDKNNSGIWYPYADYGRLVKDKDGSQAQRSNKYVLPIEYARPWFYVTGLLEKGFCVLGYGFKSPLFISDLGRKMIAYITDPNFGLVPESEQIKTTAKRELSSFVANTYTGNPQHIIINWTVVEDPEGSINTVGLYQTSGEVNMKGGIKIKNQSSQQANIRISVGRVIDRTVSDFTQDEIEFEQFEAVESGGVVEFEFDLTGVALSSEEELGVWVYARHTEFTPGVVPGIGVEDGTLEITKVRNYTKPGSTEQLVKWIDPELTFMDLLKGLSEMFELKIKTNPITRQVQLYQPHRAKFFGEDIEGFYIEETIEDIINLINEESNETTTPNSSNPRYIKMDFKDGPDPYYDSFKVKEALWSGTVDLGDKYTVEETRTIKNSFFEPTLNRQQNNRFNPVNIPVVRGDDAEISWKSGPRIVLAAGFVTQEYTSPRLKLCSYGATSSKLIPLSYQFPTGKLGTIHNNETAPQELPKDNLVFGITLPFSNGITTVKTLIDLIHRRYLIEQLNNLKINALMYLSLKKYSEIDFRTTYKFIHEGRTINARMQSVTDYQYGSDLLTPVEFIPLKQVTDICYLLPDLPDPEPEACVNVPTVSALKLDNCYQLSIGGVNNSPIIEGMFQYRLASGGPWIDLTNITPVTSIICDLIEPFYVRVVVDYDVCPDVTSVERLIIPCSDLSMILECLKVNQIVGEEVIPGIKFRVNVPTGEPFTHSATVTIDSDPTISYPMELSGPYIIGDLITEGTDLEFTFTIQVGSCPPVTLTKTCMLPDGGDKLCDEVVLNLICVNEEGCYRFVKDGLIPFDYDDYIKYRTSEDGVNWSSWKILDEDFPLICGSTYVQGRWFVVFCEGVCPMKCSPIATCMPTPFEISVTCELCTATVSSPEDISGCTIEWTGPEGWTGSGNPVMLPEVSGDYTVVVTCGIETSSFIYEHHAPNAGEDSVVDWED